MGEGVVKYNESDLPFKQMENINKFLQACNNYGVHQTDLFMVTDLYEGQNMPAVLLGVTALARKVSKTSSRVSTRPQNIIFLKGG